MLELIEKHHRQERKDIVPRVVDFVGHVIAGKHLSVAIEGARRLLHGLEKPVLEVLKTGRVPCLINKRDDA